MSAQDESSLSRMRTLQFNDKMSTLNRDFIKSLRVWYEQCPHYDFSDTVGSYLRHVAGLEKQYGLKTDEEQENGVTDENKPLKESGGDRKIAKARRRLQKDSSKLNDSVAVSTPARVPPRFSLGNVSAIAPSETPDLPAMEPPSAQGGRKRVIRGGGPNNERESVHFRGSDASANTIEVPPVTIQLPKPSAGFWDKHKDESYQGTMPRFNIVKPAAEVLPPGMENKDESPFLLGKTETKEVEAVKVDENAKKETVSAEMTKVVSPIIFGSKTSSEPAKPGFSFGSFNTSKSDSNESVGASKSAVSFPVFGAKKEGEKDSKPFQFGSLGGEEKKEEPVKTTSITFPTFGAKKKDDQPADKPALSFPTFGTGSAPKLTLGTGPALTFGAQPAASGLIFGAAAPAPAGENKEEEEGEYVPPKAEVVENEEPGATYSVKCSVFKMVDKKFEKMGIGMLHLKETDGKKSVLVRAANTMGTVWVNALINATMKVAKADEKGEKMRLTVPLSASEMGIFLIRFPNVASAEKVQKHVEENSK